MYNDDYYNGIYEKPNVSEETMQDKKKNKQGKLKGFFKVTIYAIIFGIIGGASFQGYNYVTDKIGSGQLMLQANAKQLIKLGTGAKNGAIAAVSTGNLNAAPLGNVSKVVENVMPSIVSINSTYLTSTDVFGNANESKGSGSGIIMSQNDTEILIATNNHVVDGAQTVEVVFADESAVTATVKGTNPNSDLAVVAVKISDLKDKTRNMIKLASIGDSNQIKVGDVAIAIGNALGYGQSVTVGYISAKNRTVQMEDSTMKLLQTDAAINPGNSGGALLNSNGQVIGINSAKYSSEEVEGMGYAIPISDAVPIINELMNQKKMANKDRAYLGIIGQDVTEAYAQRFNMPIGIYVSEVSTGSPAAAAGLSVGSIITAFNDKTIQTFEELQKILSYTKAGEKAVLTVQLFDNGSYKGYKVNVTLGSISEKKS